LANPARLLDGTEIQIVNPGTENTKRGGPDFQDASIIIDGITLHGDIELHREPKHWVEHGHGEDHRYGKLILHVVLEADEDTPLPIALPTLVLKHNLSLKHELLWKELFERLYNRAPELPCFPHNIQLPIRFKKKVLDRFGDARLDELISRIAPTSETSRQELKENLYKATLDALGYSENRKPFKELAELLPLSMLTSVRKAYSANSTLAFDALFFGTAGLLPQPSNEFDKEANEYVLELRSMFESVKLVTSVPYQLAESDWAFFRIRPLNTPYRRLAIASYLAREVFSQELSLDEIAHFFGQELGTGLHSFWESRTSYTQLLEAPHSLLGEERRSALRLNVLEPLTIYLEENRFRKANDGEHSYRKAGTLRSEWGKESSKTSARYIKTIEQELLESVSVNTVRLEQGALFLKRNYCDRGRCSECLIGQKLEKPQ